MFLDIKKFFCSPKPLLYKLMLEPSTKHMVFDILKALKIRNTYKRYETILFIIWDNSIHLKKLGIIDGFDNEEISNLQQQFQQQEQIIPKNYVFAKSKIENRKVSNLGISWDTEGNLYFLSDDERTVIDTKLIYNCIINTSPNILAYNLLKFAYKELSKNNFLMLNNIFPDLEKTIKSRLFKINN